MTTKVFEPITGRSLIREQVRDRLAERIISGELPPLEEIRDVDFQSEFGVSRTPVREAILQLVGIGLIEMSANRYTRVAPVDLRQQADRAEAAAALIGAAARQCAAHLTDDDIGRITEILALQRQIPLREMAHSAALDGWYHLYLIILERAGNEVVLDYYRDQLAPHLRRSLGTPAPDAVHETIRQFLEQFEAAVRARDGLAMAVLVEQGTQIASVQPLRAAAATTVPTNS